MWSQAFWPAAALPGGVRVKAMGGNTGGVCVIERVAARKGGGSPKGLTPHVAWLPSERVPS